MEYCLFESWRTDGELEDCRSVERCLRRRDKVI